MNLTWHDLQKKLVSKLNENVLTNETFKRQISLEVFNFHHYCPSKMDVLPEDCSDYLDEGHQVLYYHQMSEPGGRLKYSWNDLIADVTKMTPEQQNQNVTVFDMISKEAHQVDDLVIEDGFPYLTVYEADE